MENFDVIVVGAGHAGCEAALATARLGCRTLLLTLNLDNVAFMPCNPSIGGPGKAHLVREIDALGGEMAVNIDKTLIQIRMLNTSKGPAVQALRAQADKEQYQLAMRRVLESQPHLSLRQALVKRILLRGRQVVGIETQTGLRYGTRALILATGTFLRGVVHIGTTRFVSGPQGQQAAQDLAENLAELGFELVRFKTGTPPRVQQDSLDFTAMQRQDGDPLLTGFSFLTQRLDRPQLPCWLTHTTAKTKAIIEANLERAPMYSGQIQGTGPRYCPSIETKVVQFPHRDEHQIFIEPQGLTTREMYLGGLSTSLPEEVQQEVVHSIPGLEKAVLTRPGYAIEYDALVPTQLLPSLAHKEVEGLFTAGQVNGTSGYEEAAAQGLVAGINAVAYLRGQPPLILDRAESYIGVLIDDLVTKGTNEPYRMMTARAEYRLLLRQDNADLRLTEKGYKLGLVTPARYEAFIRKQKAIEAERERLERTRVRPEEVEALLTARGMQPVKQSFTLAQLLRRPELKYTDLIGLGGETPALPREVVAEVELAIKYAGYLEKEAEQVERFRRLEGKTIPPDFAYETVRGLSREAQEKLNRLRPRSLGQAGRISGVSPADLLVLSLYLERKHRAS